MSGKEQQKREIMVLLGQGQFYQALPLAERASRKSPRDGELASFHLLCLVNTRQIRPALELYHERLTLVDDKSLLQQSVAAAWMHLHLDHLVLRAMAPIGDSDPQAFADLQRSCREHLEIWQMNEEQAIFEQEAIELYHRQLFDSIAEQAADWVQRFPGSGQLRAVIVAAHFQLERFSEGLQWCRWEIACAALIFGEIRLLLALGRYRSARQAGKRLLRHRSRDAQELAFQLMGLLLLNQNRAVIAVSRRAQVGLELPKIQACLASAHFALGQLQEAASHLRQARGYLGKSESDFGQQVLHSGDPDLGCLRGFLLVKLFTRELDTQSRHWARHHPNGVVAPSRLGEFRKYAQQHPYLRKIAPLIWRFADLPQRMVAFLTMGVYPKDRRLRKHLRSTIRRNEVPSTSRILLTVGSVPSGVYQVGRDTMVVNSVLWTNEWSPDFGGPARELHRSTGALLAQKRYREAEAMNLRSLEFDPESTDLLYQRAVILELSGKPAESKRYLRRILKLRPDHPGARLSKADWLARHGKTRAARKLWRKVEREGHLWQGNMAIFYRAYFSILRHRNLDHSKAWFQHWSRTQPGHPFQTALPD